MFNLIKFLFDMAVGLETTLSLVQNLFGHSKQCRLKLFNPLTPMSDQDRIFPDNVNTIYINQRSDENKEKYQFWDN